MDKVHAPFDMEELREIIAYQKDGSYRPVLCPNSHVFDQHERYQFDSNEISAILFDLGWKLPKPRLLPTPEGLVCIYEACDYTKDWVWDWVIDGSWRSAERRTPIKRSASGS